MLTQVLITAKIILDTKTTQHYTASCAEQMLDLAGPRNFFLFFIFVWMAQNYNITDQPDTRYVGNLSHNLFRSQRGRHWRAWRQHVEESASSSGRATTTTPSSDASDAFVTARNYNTWDWFYLAKRQLFEYSSRVIFFFFGYGADAHQTVLIVAHLSTLSIKIKKCQSY